MLINTHSYYSLRYGVVSPKDWLSFFKAQPWTHMALTDINNTSACMTALYLLKNEPNKNAVIGVDFRNGIQQKYVVLAKNWEGFKQINDHLSWHLAHKVKFSNRAPVKRLIDTWIIYKYHEELDINSLKSNELI